MDWKLFGLLLLALFFGFVLLFAVSQGASLTMEVLTVLFIIGGVIAVVALFVGVIWYLKFYHPIAPLSKLVMDAKLRSAHLTRIPWLRNIRVCGDKDHQGVEFGWITGWTSEPKLLEKNIDWRMKEQENKPNPVNPPKAPTKVPKKPKRRKATLLHISYFAFKQLGILRTLRPEDMIMAVEDGWEVVLDEKDNIVEVPKYLPEMKQHSPLSGDIDLYCVSLTRVGRYLCPSNLAQSPMIDKIQMSDSFRQFGHMSQDELAGAVDRAMKSNYQLQMELQMKKLIDLSKSPLPRAEGFQ
jgi:hypothetical protein